MATRPVCNDKNEIETFYMPFQRADHFVGPYFIQCPSLSSPISTTYECKTLLMKQTKSKTKFIHEELNHNQKYCEHDRNAKEV